MLQSEKWGEAYRCTELVCSSVLRQLSVFLPYPVLLRRDEIRCTQWQSSKPLRIFFAPSKGNLPNGVSRSFLFLLPASLAFTPIFPLPCETAPHD